MLSYLEISLSKGKIKKMVICRGMFTELVLTLSKSLTSFQVLRYLNSSARLTLILIKPYRQFTRWREGASQFQMIDKPLRGDWPSASYGHWILWSFLVCVASVRRWLRWTPHGPTGVPEPALLSVASWERLLKAYWWSPAKYSKLKLNKMHWYE